MATIREIAEYTGFSPATISRVLNNDPTMSVTDATRAKILEAASLFQYHVPARARKLGRRDYHIAIAEMLSPVEQLKDPYYLYLKNYAIQACMNIGHTISLLTEQDGSYTCSSEKPIDGILAIGIFSDSQIEKLVEICPQIVFLDSSPDETRFDSVVTNLSLGVRQAVDHLIARGHTRIAFMGPNLKLDQKKNPAPEVRRQVFIRYLEEKGLFEEAFLLSPDSNDFDAFLEIGQAIRDMPDRPTAVLAYNEETAISAVTAFRKVGLDVPSDLSIISFNDTPISVLMDPPFTSVSVHLDLLSEYAVKTLKYRIRYPDSIPRKLVLPTSLVVRGSVSET